MNVPFTALAVLLSSAAICLVCVLLLRRLRRVRFDPAESATTISLDRYRALDRLLSGADQAFLEAQPGYEPGLGRKFRHERTRIARLYLGEMLRDFNCLCRSARLIAATSPTDASELLATVHREMLMFYAGLFRLHVELTLSSAGLSLPAFTRLTDSLARIQASLATAGMADRLGQ